LIPTPKNEVSEMFSRILVALDHSTASSAVFEQALALVAANHSELMLLHVLTPFDEIYPSDPYVGIPQSALKVYQDRWNEMEAAGLEKLRALETQAIAVGIIPEFTQSVGEPGKLICALAKTWNADLIVLGRRGLSGLRELISGSVSNYVFHHAPCAIFVMQSANPTIITSAPEKSLTASI
jgi:nucleotide-binding universal stress UspA family protein